VSNLDRAQASDDFDARLKYAQQELELVRLEGDASLSRERETSMRRTNLLTLVLGLVGATGLVAMAVFFMFLRKSNRRLQAALDARWQALMQTSHELRNPISGVLGLSELLLKMPLTPPQRSMIEAIRSAGGTIGKLAQDLLDRGQLESGRLSLTLQRGSLRHLTEGVCELYRPRAREKGLALTLDLSPELDVPVMLDEERLQQVLSNLVGNSLKFTESGSIDIILHLVARSSDGRFRVRFAVNDSGPGMDDAEQAQLFKPFTKGLAGKRHRAGAGLGLAISADLVRLMGGEIQVQSQPGQGSRFSFEIELKAATEAVAPVAVPAANAGSGLRVLLVDDDEDCTLALCAQLEMLGCSVDTAQSSQAARQRLSNSHYDLMLLDVELPDGRGPEFAKTLRSGEGPVTDRNVRIAIASGHAPPDTLPSGVDEWLMKPIMLERLHMLVASVRLVHSAPLEQAA
jgi:signal transduction histidine kinase/CheY-like chemotaxis protein